VSKFNKLRSVEPSSTDAESRWMTDAEAEEKRASSISSRGRRSSAADRFNDRRMPIYARAAAQHPVLDAASERSLAREIVELGSAVWSAALGDPAIAPFAAEFAVARLKPAARSLASVQEAAERARSERSAPARQTLRRAASRAGARLRELDPDHEVLDELVALLEAAAADPDVAPRGLARAVRARAFAGQVEAVSQAQRAVTDARHRLAQANIGLVFHVAGKYPQRSMTLPDLVQEGMLGLLKAIDRFDYRRGFRFSTYATWWIRHHIGRALSDKSRLIRVPVHVQESNQKLAAVSRQLNTELGREPTIEELSRASGLAVEAIEQIREAIRAGQLSLDESIGDDEDRTRHELLAIPDPDAGTAFDSIHRQGMARAARRQMEKRLSRVELDVLRKRFALDGIDREWTLQEIAETHGLSRERIRQIQDRALERLRAGLEEERIDAEAA
jgi:RNA polymerase primary sigma factor